MGIASSWSKGERLDHLDQNRLDGAVYWTEIGFSTYFDIPISSESYIFISSTASQVFIFSSPHILIFHQRSGMVGPFRPTPEYEAGYSCFQQVRFENQFFISFCNSKSGTVAFNRWGLKISFFISFWFPVFRTNPSPSNTFKPPWTTNSANKKHKWRYDFHLMIYWYLIFLQLLRCCICAAGICVFWGANLKLNDERRMQEDIIDDEPINLR